MYRADLGEQKSDGVSVKGEQLLIVNLLLIIISVVN